MLFFYSTCLFQRGKEEVGERKSEAQAIISRRDAIAGVVINHLQRKTDGTEASNSHAA